MLSVHKEYCSRCKDGSPDVKYYKNTNKKGVTTQYYYCRSCNNIRGRQYYKKNKEKCRQIIYKSIAKHQHKQDARIALNCHLRKNNIDRPGYCEQCGSAGNIQGHHEDYNKPLEVTWLCIDCHTKTHKHGTTN